MKAFFRNLGLIFVAAAFTGCAVIFLYPSQSTEARFHPLGMHVYNMSRQGLEGRDWELWFYLIDVSFRTLKDCAGFEEKDLDEKMRRISFVLTPPRPISIWGGKALAFTDLEYIFIRRDHLSTATIRNEWLHVYLWLTGKRWAGDPFHRDSLFRKCEYLPGEQ